MNFISFGEFWTESAGEGSYPCEGRPRRAAPTFTLEEYETLSVNVGVALRGHPIVVPQTLLFFLSLEFGGMLT